jgi:hypothetical protein
MGYSLGDRVLICGRGKIFVFIVSGAASGPPSILSNVGNWTISSAVKRSGRETGHSPPSGTESTNIGDTPLLA